MKTFKFISTLAIVILFTSCNYNQNKEKKTDAIEIISHELFENIDSSVQLIDVRTPKEYAEGHIKHATNINFFEDNFIEQMSSLDKGKPLYIYCKGGNRSGKASVRLVEAGFIKIYDLEGGITKWKQVGKELSN